MDKRFDVIIVGSGAGGGTLSRCLASSGKNILILERMRTGAPTYREPSRAFTDADAELTVLRAEKDLSDAEAVEKYLKGDGC